MGNLSLARQPEMDVQEHLVAAYRKLLGPLVRILLRQGISFRELAELAKEVYVQVAVRDFQIAEKEQSDARIAVLTGLTRKDVARIRSQPPEDLAPRHTHRITRVLSGWHKDREFTGPFGVPNDLEFDGESSFTELCRRYSGDMPPRAVLDELIRVGAVEEQEDSSFKVLTRAYIHAPMDVQHIDRFGAVVGEFIETSEWNLVYKGKGRAGKAGTSRFERRVFTDRGLSPDLLKEFDRYIKTEVLLVLEKLDEWLSNADQRMPADYPDEDRIFTGVGAYHFVHENTSGGLQGENKD